MKPILLYRSLLVGLCMLLAGTSVRAQLRPELVPELMQAATQTPAAARAVILSDYVREGLARLVTQHIGYPVSPTQVYRMKALPHGITNYPTGFFPLPADEETMYRGMALDNPNEQLKNIFKNGLEVTKCRAENFASYDGINSSCTATAIYASTDPNLALGYTTARLAESPKTRFPVLLHLKRLGNSLMISVPHDIPPQWIFRISTVLPINGQLRWGELKLDETEHFIFIPYPNPVRD